MGQMHNSNPLSLQIPCLFLSLLLHFLSSMLAYFSIQPSSSQDGEKLSLLHHNDDDEAYNNNNNKKRLLRYRRWILFTSIILLAFTISSLALYSLRYCSTHQCLMYRTTKAKGITVVPSIGLELNWFHALFALFYALILSISLSLRGSIHWYVMPLVVFVGFQLVQTTWILMFDRNTYVVEQLDDSWQRAYDSSDGAVLLKQLQVRLQCQGFAGPLDRNLPMTGTDATNTEPCVDKLIATFGQAIYAWGFALWVLKMIQMAGLLGCYAIYIRMADDGDDQQTSTTAIEREEKGHGTRTGQACVTVT
ncbi:hypothetical protein BDB00DRAFT_830360 [Zychaea mexicana]|uniref:uncharacterized protein n=1 Tax=Zychaea mexicana TaxID=64656 RepID=UPI0022FDCED2|nr:uncharacterized protein BDB00DRAFT_830360 [Zychaea mexicana]KAI9491938.1 hypothetical protein BDB00DRAFT_830360 [Zychaea mexicana]